jgi:hypothetical protein
LKNTLRLLACVALTVASLGLASNAGAAAVVFNVKNDTASAFFSSTDPSGCVVTDVIAIASEGAVSASRNWVRTSAATVFISQFDACTETFLLSAIGAGGLPDEDFEVFGAKLESATLSTTIPLFDEVSGSSFDVFVDLNWTAAGSLSRGTTHSHFQTAPSCINNQHMQGLFRPAEAAGTVSDGTTNFIPEPAVSAVMSAAMSGNVRIGCDPDL